MVRCYFRAGGKELADGVKCEIGVFDESRDDELKADGWRHSPHDLEGKEEPVDEELQILRNAAKERGIKGWQRMGAAKLREALGLDDDGEN
jgi:hypothetical protein